MPADKAPRIPEHSPTVAGRWLAADMRKWRLKSGFKQADVAAELGCGIAKIGHIETGHSPIRRADLLVMMPMYGVPHERRDWYLDLCAKAKQKGWWEGAEGVPSWFGLYVGLESGAEKIRSFDLGFVPGLLQTRDYMVAAISEGIRDDEHRASMAVKLRVQRQHALNRGEHPLMMHAVVDEATLRREVGNRALMRAQLKHLADQSATAAVTFQVVPFGAGVHPGQLGSFSILDFPNPDDPGVVYIETRRGGLYLEENDELTEYHVAFDRLIEQALSPEDSAEFLTKLARSKA